MAKDPARSVSIFKGRDRENNKAIIKALSLNGGMTIWEITKSVLKIRLSKTRPLRPEPKAREVQMLYPTIFRCIKGSSKGGDARTEGLESLGYVEGLGTKTSKGREVPVYNLTLRGSLAALFLRLEEPIRLRDFLENTAPVNPFFRLAREMLRWGVDENLVREILQGWKDAIDGGLLNLDIADDGTITYALFLKLQEKLIKMFEAGLWTGEALEKVSGAFRSSIALSQVGMQIQLDLVYPSLYLLELESQEGDEREREKIRLLKRIFGDLQEAVTG
jgi:predicted DNA-binding ArsR family transcriptional regulator